MPKIDQPEALSIMIDGKITEAMLRKDISKGDLSKMLKLGKETLTRKGKARTLSTLNFLTVSLIAQAAGYEIEFRRKV